MQVECWLVPRVSFLDALKKKQEHTRYMQGMTCLGGVASVVMIRVNCFGVLALHGVHWRHFCVVWA